VCPRAFFNVGGGFCLVVAEVELIDIDVVRSLVLVAVLLIVNRDAVPVVAVARIVGAIERGRLPIQGDGLE
jgi:hypothetical protein